MTTRTDQTTTTAPYVARALAAKQALADAKTARNSWVFDAAEAPDLLRVAAQIRRAFILRGFAFGFLAGIAATWAV